ncbi:alanine--tRNA ligase [Pseudomonadota bacterium]|nr:alanine--tRNA ligase [Pseudomonadota bacterium]
MTINRENSVNKIRTKFLDYFNKNNHEIISSSNLVPDNDPTLLFTNAGMVQFKNTFTGIEQRQYSRAVTSQKCLRAGGKHNDLENVGRTARHHTFFEMLGNFSFGDYFKEKAIYQAWELLIKEYNLPKEKLLVTIYHTDTEAEKLWKKISGLNDDKIIKIKTTDNFWSMGDTGPCGPCSEIFFDHGSSIPGGPPGSKDEDGDRFIEIWNLVFMQYEQISLQERVNLPKPSIDTGMGLERISAVLQNTHNNYETDMMKNLVDASCLITGVDKSQNSLISHRVVADHLRSISFLIAEGVMPSNEGRGYVLRRIMRRAMRHTHLLGATDPVIYKLVDYLCKEMGEAFPELNKENNLIKNTIKDEEIKFKDTLDRGLNLLKNEIDNRISNGTLSGEKAFELYDTYGFPLDLTEDVLKSYGWTVDHNGFEIAMNAQKDKARQSWVGSGDKQYKPDVMKHFLTIPCTNFKGYDEIYLKTKIVLLLKDNQIIKRSKSGDKVDIVFNETIFYAESGGQISDKGSIVGNNFTANVIKSSKIKLGNDVNIFLCSVEIISGKLEIGETVTQNLDLDYRKQICSHHSATHLLHEALRQKLGIHVAQKGSLVTNQKLRFDFSHSKPIEPKKLQDIENEVNERIFCNEDVITRIMTPSKAIENGAIALFGEKYGDEVRVVSMGKSIEAKRNAWSVELCGGTHVKKTSEISTFKIISETGVSSGVRRIEAITNTAAIDFYNSELAKIKIISNFLKTESAQVVKKIEQMIVEHKNINKQLKQLKMNTTTLDKNVSNKEKINGIIFEYKIFDEMMIKELKPTAENILKNSDSKIVCLISKIDNKASIVIAVNKNNIDKFSAVEMVKHVSEKLGGKGGGGRPDMAQSGGSSPENCNQAIKMLKEYIRK